MLLGSGVPTDGAGGIILSFRDPPVQWSVGSRGVPMRRFLPSLACIALTLAAAIPAATALPRPNEHWIEARTENFVLFSDAREGLTRSIGRNLERLRKALSLLSDDLEVNSPLPTYIYVFKGHGSFDRYVDTGAGPTNVPRRAPQSPGLPTKMPPV